MRATLETHSISPLHFGPEAYLPAPLDVFSAAPVLANGLQQLEMKAVGFDGTFMEVVAEIERSQEAEEASSLVLASARMVRAIIDAKVQDPNCGITFESVAAATSLSLDLYRGTAGKKDVQDFLRNNPECNLPPLTPVKQEADSVTYISSHPNKITNAANQLAVEAGDEDVLFLSLCHGGFAAGAGTFLTREMTRPDGNSVYYPVRFSRYKMGDLIPQLTDDEKSKLREITPGKRVVLFDEDVCSALTVETAQAYFQELLGCEVSFITANDLRFRYTKFKDETGITDGNILQSAFKESISTHILQKELMNPETYKNLPETIILSSLEYAKDEKTKDNQYIINLKDLYNIDKKFN